MLGIGSLFTAQGLREGLTLVDSKALIESPSRGRGL